MDKIKITALSFMLLVTSGALAQRHLYNTYKDTVDGGVVFNGPLSFDDLDNEASFTWFKNGVEEYKPYTSTIDFLRTYMKDYTMVVFMGTWCDDSHNLIPKLEKVLRMINYPAGKITMYGTDREKKTKSGEDKTYQITLVPTIILVKDGKEMGRITETVKKSIEDDLAAIITFQPGH